MSIHIIVDGYNMIRNSSWLRELDQQNLKLGRDTLIKCLADYKKLKGHFITVVFDGIDMPQYCQRDIKNGIKIKFSQSTETADQVINQIVRREKQKALVVTCDREVINFAESHGASVIDSPAFEKKIVMMDYSQSDNYVIEQNCCNRRKKIITRKKGPRKKLPRNKRKHQVRIKKL